MDRTTQVKVAKHVTRLGVIVAVLGLATVGTVVVCRGRRCAVR